jgi:predicted nucleic-acid-binding protein
MAIQTLERAELVAISAHSLCEFVWVLDQGYKTARSNIASVISQVLEVHNVVVNRPAVEAGLRVLEAGGDFADGVIAYDGNWLGGETFVSFDKRAVSLVKQQGQRARFLA